MGYFLVLATRFRICTDFLDGFSNFLDSSRCVELRTNMNHACMVRLFRRQTIFLTSVEEQTLRRGSTSAPAQTCALVSCLLLGEHFPVGASNEILYYLTAVMLGENVWPPSCFLWDQAPLPNHLFPLVPIVVELTQWNPMSHFRYYVIL